MSRKDRYLGARVSRVHSGIDYRAYHILDLALGDTLVGGIVQLFARNPRAYDVVNGRKQVDPKLLTYIYGGNLDRYRRRRHRALLV
jgi:hypothetical protein